MMLHSLCGKSSLLLLLLKNIEIYVYNIIAHDMQKIKVILNEQKSLFYIFFFNKRENNYFKSLVGMQLNSFDLYGGGL